MLEIKDTKVQKRPNIFVIGIGGAGNNAVGRMSTMNFENISYIAVNTDVQVLESCPASIKLPIGQKLTGGYGAGSDPAVGQASAKESEEEISAVLENADMVILTCGLGGGTGTGAIPVIAKMSKDRGILTVAVVTLPFSFEGEPRSIVSQNGLKELTPNVDMLLVIPNDKLLTISNKPFYIDEAFDTADSVLKSTILGITGIIFHSGFINVDFNDIRTTISGKGLGHLGIGTVSADGNLLDAVKQAVNSPLLETDIKGATNILFNTSGRVNIVEVNEALNYVRNAAGTEVNIKWGTVTDPDDTDRITVTLIATGMKNQDKEKSPAIISQDSKVNDSFFSVKPASSTPVYSSKLTPPSSKIPESQKIQLDSGIEIPEFLLAHSHTKK